MQQLQLSFVLILPFIKVVLVAAASCQPPFSLIGGECLYANVSKQLSWCEAAQFCLGIGGELVIDIDKIRALRISGLSCWAGVTDLLVERGSNRTGWQLTNGGTLDEAKASDWELNNPNSNGISDDFLVASDMGLVDLKAQFTSGTACQPLVTPDSSLMRRVSFPKLGNITSTYCFTEQPAVSHWLRCVQLCTSRWQCRAALHNRAESRCRMLDFTDASVGDEIELNPLWVKFVKAYY